MTNDSLNTLIDEFVKKTKALMGKELSERECWNTVATQDAIRHFAYGISDDNPLWLDPAYAAKTQGCLLAPPTFLASVLYPHLHGEPMEVPLANLIGDLEFQWYAPIFLGDSFRTTATVTGVYESKDRAGRRLVYVLSEINYRNQQDVVVGKALGTMVRYDLAENDLLNNRTIYQYTPEELHEIGDAQTQEARTGSRPWTDAELFVGQELPPLVRGPLTIGDLICWQAAIGPSYRSGSLGYVDSLSAPHNAVKNPLTGWPVKYSQQHEDFLLASQRGMPAPFDNGVMRLAWIGPLLTNWIGDSGALRRLSVQIMEPILYGDTNWYRGVIAEKSYNTHGVSLKINLTGTNQLNVTTTQGVAEVFIPLKAASLPSQSPLHSQERPKSLSLVKAKEQEYIHALFEAQARNTPDRLAVSCEEQSVTYAELNRRADLLAQSLKELGVGPEHVVGIYLDRSIEAILSILAVLKAGGAYLVFDQDYPQRRMHFMLKDACVRVLLTQEWLRETFSDFSGTLVCLDRDQEHIRAVPPPNSHPVLHPKNLAYCMYTSGTTDEPKRVGVSHVSLTTYIQSLKQTFPLSSDDWYLQTASMAFSASTRQIFLPLCSGATIHIATTEQRQDPFILYHLIGTRQITVWDTVPSVWKNCGNSIFGREKPEAKPDHNPSLRLILLTGEALDTKTVNGWKAHLQESAKIVNLYSQTESAGTISFQELEADEGNLEESVPIGRALPDTRLYVLDHQIGPAENGKSGRMFVGGERMARGYLNRPDLTATQFIPDPFGSEPGQRLLSTGDLGCQETDGSFRWTGRSDQQVKVRGYRVELGEIETLLRQHDDIAEVVVVKQGDSIDNYQVVTYVVPRRLRELTTESLQAYLKYRIPSFMLPTSFMFLEVLPRTLNGKIDHRALPLPDLSAANLGTTYEAPQDPFQEILIAVWQEVLGKEPIGVNDDFFELGGQSLMATQVIVRLRERHNIDIPLSTIFDHPTVGQLAGTLSSS